MPGSPLDALDPVFQAAGTEWNVDPMLLKAIAMQESRGNVYAYNKASRAAGLMQIVPETAKALGVDNPFDPTQSIWGAAKLMDEALTAEGGSVEQALLYYHGGPDWRAPNNWGPESRAYVPGVAGYYKGFAAAAQKQQQQQTPPQTPAPQPTPAPAPAVSAAEAPTGGPS